MTIKRYAYEKLPGEPDEYQHFHIERDVFEVYDQETAFALDYLLDYLEVFLSCANGPVVAHYKRLAKYAHYGLREDGTFETWSSQENFDNLTLNEFLLISSYYTWICRATDLTERVRLLNELRIRVPVLAEFQPDLGIRRKNKTDLLD